MSTGSDPYVCVSHGLDEASCFDLNMDRFSPFPPSSAERDKGGTKMSTGRIGTYISHDAMKCQFGDGAVCSECTTRLH